MNEGMDEIVRGPEEDSQSELGDARVQVARDSLDDAINTILLDSYR